jgi:rubrerythrin
MIPFTPRAHRRFADLSEREILALAIGLEEEDGRIYRDYAEGLKQSFPASAEVFQEMAEEESEHRRRLIDLYAQKFGEHIPLIRREHVRGFVRRKPLWLTQNLGVEAVRKQAEEMEVETTRFYRQAAKRATDASIRKLLGDLAEAESSHVHLAERLERRLVPTSVKDQEAETQRRTFLLQIIQPGLAGLMDGSVSTLAPVFAAAFATGNSRDAFLVGIAASIGAGISMGFAEALSDDGSLTGRGQPLLRGIICGAMTALGGIGHTLPYLIPDFRVATTIAIVVVVIELWIIAWVRARYMDTPFLSAAFQVVVGGFLVFLTGILLGNA